MNIPDHPRQFSLAAANGITPRMVDTWYPFLIRLPRVLVPMHVDALIVRQGGGSVEKDDVWGRRRLAYEIDKHVEGIYAVVDVQAEPATVAELDRQLNLTESVLRTKVIRPDKR